MYLCRSEVDEWGEVFPLRGGQVLLLLEPSLQLIHLQIRKVESKCLEEKWDALTTCKLSDGRTDKVSVEFTSRLMKYKKNILNEENVIFVFVLLINLVL